MEFKLKYNDTISAKSCGVFVEDANMMSWLEAASELKMEQVQFFPVPGKEANSLSGALLISSREIDPKITQFPCVYSAGGAVYLLLSSTISPQLNEVAIVEKFAEKPHFFHPVYGLIELQEIKDWSPHLSLESTEITVQSPESGPNFPNRLGEYFVREIEPEEVLKSLIEKSVPDRKSLESKPLTSWEKMKLKAYRLLLGKKGSKNKKESEKEASSESGSQGAGNETIVEKKSWWKRKKAEMSQSLENLEERNKKELQKLMDMLKNDPDEALKYALPIDRSGHSRGPEVGFTMQRRWGLGFSGGLGSGGSVNIGESKADLLRRQYQEMAANYAENKQWEKASFVHLELLSDPLSAAHVLKQGKKYEEAAVIYLSKCKQKLTAAECYELGNFYGRAVDLYEEMDQQEKVGDLYVKMGNPEKAKRAYDKEIETLTNTKRFYRAGELAQNKLSDTTQARQHFMEGWKFGRRPKDCLNEYFKTHSIEGKRESIQRLHGEQMEGQEAHRFLEVLKLQIDNEAELESDIEQVAYETIARNASRDKSITNLLSSFNNSDLVSKDVMRFKHGRRAE